MKVLLAGYNIDTEVLNELTKDSKRSDVTPETLSASYARISRDPRPINELRKVAREEVDKARKSNKAIIFKMGHHSVAEHAVFNFDIIDVSRLAIEAIEKFRLCSFTEKSQRYITLTDDFLIPEEIEKTGFKDEFVKIIKLQNETYHKLNEKLQPYVLKKYPELAKDPKKRSMLEGWAKEDARYIVSMATFAQLGLTVNARNLELMFRRFASSNLAEINKLGREIYNLVERIAPSIILFAQANDFDKNTYSEIKKLTSEITKSTESTTNEEVSLIDYTKDADNLLIASLIHTTSNISMNDAQKLAKKLSQEEKLNIIKTACKKMELYDTCLREWEYPELVFELTISSACFGQLKRHRITTQTYQKYNPKLGLTIPESIMEVGLENLFKEVTGKTEELYYKIKKENELAAPYILTNAHRRRVLLKTNARELYHIARLREDFHAQWDIRNISCEMSKLAKKVMPLTFLTVCGKDKYPKVYEEIFGEPPKVIEPTLPGQ